MKDNLLLYKTKKYIVLLLLSALLGLFSGVVAFLFYKTVTLVSGVRSNYGFIILLLPVGGLMSVHLNKLLKTGTISTNTVINSSFNNKRITPFILPAIFISSAITHLFGASAGREGAALQMGVGEASVIDRLFKLKEEDRSILTICGLASVFSALFSAPLGAAVFALEVVFTKKKTSKAYLPVFVASFVSYTISFLLGTKPERFEVESTNMSISLLLKLLVISVIVSFVGILFIFSMRFCSKVLKASIPNEYLLIAIGGSAILILTIVIGDQRYNGSGINLIEEIFIHNKVNGYDFLLKIVFTVISISAGFKGGEIVPTFSIGATLGAVLALLFNLDITVGAAIGMAVMFNSVTKCPIATVFICLELFGIKCLPLCILVVAITVFISSQNGIYEYKQNNFTIFKFIKASQK